MNPQLQQILTELRAQLEALYGERLERLVLYGSQARGDAEPDSDIDVLVVLRGEVNPYQEILHSEDVTTAVSQQHGVFISPMFVSTDEYRRGDKALLTNVRREGIAL